MSPLTRVRVVAFVSLSIALVFVGPGWTLDDRPTAKEDVSADKDNPEPPGKTPAVLKFKMKGLDGKEVDLAKYRGKVVLFVNVASRCGYTPQYRQLQEIYDKYNKRGLVVIGIPANEFGRQEPDTDAEIAKFISTQYKVTFPMLAKVVVKGKGIVPLYEYLTKTNKKFGGEIQWNFTKFVIGRNGEVVARFEPKTKPDAAEVIAGIEAELKKR